MVCIFDEQVFDNVRQAHIMCSFFNLFGWGSSDMGLLLTVAMTTERSLAIKFPLKATVLCSVRRAKIVSGGLFALEFVKVLILISLLFLLSIPLYFFFS